MAVDLKAFEKRLKKDKELRSEFLENPAKTLEAEGLILPDAARKHLAELAVQLKAKGWKEQEGPHIKVSIEH